jgi:hypothetical protein
VIEFYPAKTGLTFLTTAGKVVDLSARVTNLQNTLSEDPNEKKEH